MQPSRMSSRHTIWVIAICFGCHWGEGAGVGTRGELVARKIPAVLASATARRVAGREGLLVRGAGRSLVISNLLRLLDSNWLLNEFAR